jgi:hypothetical protein
MYLKILAGRTFWGEISYKKYAHPRLQHHTLLSLRFFKIIFSMDIFPVVIIINSFA